MTSYAAGRALALAGALTALLAAVLAAGCAAPAEPDVPAAGDGVARVSTPRDTTGFAGTVLDEPYRMPALRFTDTAGRPFHLVRDTRAAVTVVFFGYTHCPDVCGTVLADAAAALRRAAPAVRARVQLVFITTDPARDSPAVIRDYLDRFHPAFVGLTAPLPTVARAAAALGVALEEDHHRLAGGGYEVAHGAQLIGFDARDRGRVVWTPGTPVADLRADLTRLATTPG